MRRNRDIGKILRTYFREKVGDEKEKPSPYQPSEARWPENLKLPPAFPVFGMAAAMLVAFGVSYLMINGYRDYLSAVVSVLSERYHWHEQLLAVLTDAARHF